MKDAPAISRWTKGYLALVLFSILGTFFSKAAQVDPGWIAPVSAIVTLLVGTVAVFAGSGVQGVAILGVVALGLAVELIGVRTGYPFGRYEYTDQWKPVIWITGIGWFPLAVPLAWLMMVGGATLTARHLRYPAWTTAILAGVLAALIDLAMEPAMVTRPEPMPRDPMEIGAVGYWHWIDTGPLWGGAPIQNFVGWALAAGLGAAILLKASGRLQLRGDPAVVLAGHFALAIALILGRR